MTVLERGKWPVLMLASVAGLPLIFQRMVLGVEGAALQQALQVEHRLFHYIAAAAVVAISWAWTIRGAEAQESKGKNTITSVMMRDRSKENFCQRVVTDAQDVWWQYVGLPLHFRVTRAAGLIKGVMQQSVFVVWESTRLAPKRFEWWLERRAEEVSGKLPDSQDLTSKDIRILESMSHTSGCVSAVVEKSGPCSARVKQVIPDIFLLHFGALCGEKASQSALQALDRMKDLGSSHGLFGKAEETGWYERQWKKPIVKSKPGISFNLEKKYLRKGLFLYRTSTVIENATIEDFCKFNLSLEERKEWDWTMAEFARLEDTGDKDCDKDSGFVFLESRMPGPMANREYLYARRVWRRPDGSCYHISVSSPHDQVPKPRGRNVRVDEFGTAFIMRPTKSRQGRSTPAVEMASLYFDAPKMRSVAYNLAMNSGMWTAVQGLEENFRKFQCRTGCDSLVLNPQMAQSGRRERRRAVLRRVGGVASGACKVAAVVAIAALTRHRPKLK